MSDLNHYAKDLDASFERAAEAQRKAGEEMEKAKQAASIAETPAEKAEAEERVNKAKAGLEACKRETWPAFQKERERLTNELQKELDKAAAVDPSELDAEAVNLLHSDILTRNDIKELSEKYKGNATMTRMIGARASEMAEKERDIDARRELNYIAHESRGAGKDKMTEWGSIVDASKHYSGELNERAETGYTMAMNEHWRDAGPQSMIENF